MEQLSSGAGFAALGFWIFIAATIAVGVWDNIRKRDTQHETLRRIIESGQTIDDELTDKLIALTGGHKDLERDYRVTAVILCGLAPGLALFGWIMGIFLAPELTWVMLAVAILLLFIAAGMYAAALLVKRWQKDSMGLDRIGADRSGQ